jgi:hypothetical protein
MTNYNERLDEILKVYFWPDDVGESETLQATHDAAKQAITSLNKELVAEAKPPHVHGTTVSSGQFNRGVSEFEQNLLKALEEVWARELDEKYFEIA